MEKTCKQCGQLVDNYRKYAARGKGIYKTEQGYHTICKECESINSRAIQLEKDPSKDPVLYAKLVDYYKALESRGLGIASAVAGRYLGKDKPVAAARSINLTVRLDSVINAGQADVLRAHLDALRDRTYSSLEEAGRMQDTLAQQLRAAGLYEEADRLLEDWEYAREEED